MQDGKKYRDFVRNLPASKKYSYATYIMNTDGAQVFQRSQKSLWPIYIMLNELPIAVRMKNIVTCGLWFGRKKPDMSAYLKAFVDFSNQNLTEFGIKCQIKGQERKISLYCLICCVDTIARPTCQASTQFNGHWGCSWCFHKSKSLGNTCYYPILRRRRPDLRDMTSTLVAMEEAAELRKTKKTFSKQEKKRLKGIQGRTPLADLVGFNIIFGFCPDYMHACLSGVSKRITERLLETVSEADIDYMSSEMERLKVPNQLAQLPRPLHQRHLWKAKEWESWVLYYGLPIMSLKLKQKYVDFWALYSNSMYILLKKEISFQEIEEVNKNLASFVALTESYFGLREMTYNIHQLVHLSKSVYDWGPLWAHSCFSFESSNHDLVKSVHSANGVNVQIIRFLGMCRCFKILEKTMKCEMSESVRDFYEN